MKSARLHTKGFTLIASLLLLTLLSGMAIGLMMMVNTEGKVGGADLQNDVAYHSAEGGIEKMASDLAATFQNSQSPTAAQICAVSNTPPVMAGVTWTTYTVTPVSGCTQDPPTHTWGQISSGPDQGLWAQIIPVNLQATAELGGGQEVSMLRTAQVALIPVFQFGVFSESDLAFFSNPTLDFNGRIHTNGDLYVGVASGNTIEFHDKVEAYGNVVTNNIPNTLPAAGSANDTGTVYMPNVSPGCNPTNPPTQNPPTDTQCVTMAKNQGSVTGMGGNPPASAYNGTGGWYTFSKTTTGYQVINGNYGNTAVNLTGTGAKKLSMPFVGGNALPYEIIRRPPGKPDGSQEEPTSALGTSREYNMAQIRVLLSDDPSEFQNSTTPATADPNNIRLANVTQATVTANTNAGNAGWTVSNPYGITMTAGNYPAALAASLPAGDTYNLYFAAAANAVPVPSTCGAATCTSSDWPLAPLAWSAVMAANGGNPYPLLVPTGSPIDSNNGTPTINLCPPATVAVVPAGCPSPATGAYPYYAPSASPTAWNLIDGWLRVEYKDQNGNWNPVTQEWLNLGFARDITPPTLPGSQAPAAGTNDINPNAILLLQEPADRVGNGAEPTSTATAPTCKASSHGVCTSWTAGTPPQVASDQGSGAQWYFGVTPAAPATQSLTQNNWYPINFYDAREGEARDVDQGNISCTTNGVMNAVEIDVGNLKRWLMGLIGKNPNTGVSSGPNVDYLAQNGYVLYFSDRRGMLLNPSKTGPHPAGSKSGDSGLEDVVNSTSQAGTPDTKLEPVPVGAPLSPAGVALSPEDDNENGVLDNFGTANMGLGQYNGAVSLNPATGKAFNPYGTRIASCSTTGEKNWVSGARHVLKLVDGSLGNVPLITVGAAANTGGFTVASENPLYIQGNYNSSAADTFFTKPSNTAPANDVVGHSAAAVVADAVTILSNNWNDRVSLGMGNVDVTAATSRPAATTYYRLAIAGGKNMSFPFPGWANANPDYPFGTDGGVGNFLRLSEDWSGQTLHYGGSLVSLYYATYNTGIFKCCTYSVYEPPDRDYIFDADFTLPEGLPPGTPMFRDVESLGYRQLFTTRTAGQ